MSDTVHAQSIVERVASALAGDQSVATPVVEVDKHWTLRHFELKGAEYPVQVDVVSSNHVKPRRVIYLLPGGGTSFLPSFFTPRDENLVHFLNERGYLVVGISARENLLVEQEDYPKAAGWGMAARRADIRMVVERVQAASRLPYEMLGHSYGASSALDYGAHYSDELERVIALDIYSIDPATDPQGIANAEATYAAHVQLLSQGVTVDTSGAGARAFSIWTDEQRRADSGVSREPFGAMGNFTNEGLYVFAGIRSALLGGIHSQITGLAGDWPLRGGTFAGEYTFAPDPRNDSYSFVHIDRGRLTAASSVAGSGLIPLAFARDYWSVVAGNGAYVLDWAAIRCKLAWVNSELGYAEQSHGAELARRAGNANVSTAIVPNYGHADVLLGKTARRDVWKKLF